MTAHVDGKADAANGDLNASRATPAAATAQPGGRASPPNDAETRDLDVSREGVEPPSHSAAGATSTRRGRVARRFADVLLVVVGLGAMVWMDRHRPNLDANQAPFPTRGRIGSAVRGRDFALTVERVALTRTLDVPGTLSSSARQRRETGGVWLLVDARLEALREPTALPGGVGAPSLRTRDGVVYASAGGRMPMGVPLLTNANAAPGMPARGLLIFELPPERLPGVVLVASRRTLSELDSIVEIDLGLAEADVRLLVETMPASITLDRSRASW